MGKMIRLSRKAVGGILLISSTTIGVGMLALPLSTANLGIGYSCLAFAIVSYFMIISAFMLLESNLVLGKSHNLGFLAKATLGRPGLVVTMILYLMLLYALVVAHLSAGAAWLVNKAQLHGLNLDFVSANIGLGIFIYLIICAGTWLADAVNRVFMLVLFSLFVILGSMLAQHTSPTLLMDKPNLLDWSVFPLLMLAFGFHVIIPTLANYIEDPKQARLALGIGSLIPLFVYIGWEMLIFGVLPFHGQYGLEAIAADPQPTNALMQALEVSTGATLLGQTVSVFTITVLTTSFIGISVSLFDFLADSFFDVKNTLKSRLYIGGITLLPPMLFVLTKPNLFLEVLDFAGLCVAALLGIIPTLIFWKMSQQQPTPSRYYFAKRWHMILNILFFLGIILIECHNLWMK